MKSRRFPDPNRGTGRTTQMLKRACRDAAGGGVVLVIVHSAEMRKYALDLLSNLGASFEGPQPRVKFGWGEIKVWIPSQVANGLGRGHRWRNVEVDHAVWDTVDRKTFPQFWPELIRLETSLEMA